MTLAAVALANSIVLPPESDPLENSFQGNTETITLSCGGPAPTLSEILAGSAVVVEGRWICVEADADAADSLEFLDVDDVVDGPVPWTVEGWFERLERFVAEDLEEELVPGRLQLEPAGRFDAPVRPDDAARRIAIGIRVETALKGDAPAWIPIGPEDAPTCRKDAAERRKVVVHAALARDEQSVVPLVLDTSWVSETLAEARDARRILSRGLELLASEKRNPADWHRFVVDAVAHPATREDALGDLYRSPDGGDGESVYAALTEEEFRTLEKAYVANTRDVLDAWLFLDVFDDRPSSQIDRATARLIASSLEQAGPSLDDADRFDHSELWYLAQQLAERVRGEEGPALLANLAFDRHNDDTAYWRMMWPVVEALLFSGSSARSAQTDAPQP